MTVYNGTRKGLNVTVIGNPTINGTVVSGFSKTNYVRTPEPLKSAQASMKWVVQLSIVFTNPSTITEIVSGDELTFLLRANNNKLALFASSNGTSWDIADQVYGSYVLQAGKEYIITIESEPGHIGVDIKEGPNGSTYHDISIHPDYSKYVKMKDKYIYFGWFNRTYFPGASIDLKYCLTKVNYKETWRAYDDMPRKIEDIYYSGPKKYWKETPDYSPSFITIDNFIARPSSDQFMSSKVVTKNDFDSVTNMWYVITNYTFDDPNKYTLICNTYNAMYLKANNGYLIMYAKTNSGTVIANDVIGTTLLSSNVEYYFKFGFTGKAYVFYISTDKGKTWTLEKSFSSTLPPRVLTSNNVSFGNWTNRSGYDEYAEGSFDLRGVSIINSETGDTIWKAVKSVEGTKEDHTYSEPDVKQILSIHKPTGNIIPNVTVVGSPTITDNVVSGISLGNFLTMPEVFNPGDNSWEIVIRAKTAATRSHRDWLIGSGNTAGQDYRYITMGLENNGKPLLYLSSNGSSWNIASAVTGSTILDTDTYYLFRLRFIRVGISGAVYIYDISSDNGQSWTEEIRINSTYSVFVPAIPYAIGISYYSRSPNQFWAGSIDLSQSYIKINGKYWWKGTKPGYALLYNKNISLLKAEDFNSIKESSSGVAIWGGDAISTGSQGGGIQNLKQQDSITFNKSLPAGKYTVTFNYYSQVNFTMRLVQFTATYEDGTTEVVYSNTSLGDTAYGGGEKADVTTTMTFNKRIKGITTLAQGSGGGNGCYGGFGKVRMSLSGAQQ